MNKFNNILLIRTGRIGDVVLSIPVIKALRKAYPLARISILITPSTLPLLMGNPYIDEVLLDDRSSAHKGVFGFLKLVRQIRLRNFDAVFVFHTKRRYNIAAFMAGIPVRIGYKNEKCGFLLTRPIKDTRHLGQKHEVQYGLDVLKEVGIDSTHYDFYMPVDKDAEQWANEWLASHSIKSGEFIVIHAGASGVTSDRCWPIDHFVKLIDSLHKRYFYKVILIGGSDIKECSNQIMHLTGQKPLNLTGETTLAQSISLLRRSRILISNDSGPVHMGSALGIYVLAIFMRNHPGINFERWKPLPPKGMYLYSPKGVEVHQVLDTVENIFQRDSQEFFRW